MVAAGAGGYGALYVVSAEPGDVYYDSVVVDVVGADAVA